MKQSLHFVATVVLWVVIAPPHNFAAEDSLRHVMHVGYVRSESDGKTVNRECVAIDGNIYTTIWELEEAVAKLPSGSKLMWNVGFSPGNHFYLSHSRMKTAQLQQFCREQDVELVFQGGF